jgi:pyocin large subunit-like protein
MTRTLTSAAAACAVVLILAGAAAAPANAYYSGYGNGDPGNWDFWTEQNGGRNPETAAPEHVTTAHHYAASSHAHSAHHAHHAHKPSAPEGKASY